MSSLVIIEGQIILSVERTREGITVPTLDKEGRRVRPQIAVPISFFEQNGKVINEREAIVKAANLVADELSRVRAQWEKEERQYTGELRSLPNPKKNSKETLETVGSKDN